MALYPQQLNSASEFGLELPRIEVDPTLQHRLSRTGRSLSLDGQALLDGVCQLEIEQQVWVHIGSLPKDSSDDKPQLTYPNMRRIKVEVSPRPVTDAVALEVNEALWLGIMVADKIAEGAKSHMFAEIEKRRATRRNRSMASLFISEPGFFGVNLIPHTETLIKYATDALQAGLGAAAIAAILIAHRNVSIKNKPVNKQATILEPRLKQAAEEVAALYPVVSYGDNKMLSRGPSLFQLPPIGS